MRRTLGLYDPETRQQSSHRTSITAAEKNWAGAEHDKNNVDLFLRHSWNSPAKEQWMIRSMPQDIAGRTPIKNCVFTSQFKSEQRWQKIIKLSNASLFGAVFFFVTKSQNKKGSFLAAVLCVATCWSWNCNAEWNKTYRLSYTHNSYPIKMKTIKYWQQIIPLQISVTIRIVSRRSSWVDCGSL